MINSLPSVETGENGLGFTQITYFGQKHAENKAFLKKDIFNAQ